MASGRRFAVVASKVKATEPPSPSKQRTFAKIKTPVGAVYREPDLSDPLLQAAINVLDLEVISCCTPVIVDGVKHHSYSCAWWQLPGNETKTPF